MKLKERLIEICVQVAEDAENDTRCFDGKPFNGKTVGEYFGYQAASIKALAEVIKEIVKNSDEILLKF